MVYDLIVLGGGPAGYNAAEKAAHAGLKTLVCEKRFYGGVCLNEGCVPTKAYLYSAKLKDGAMHGDEYGINLPGEITLDHAKVNARKDAVVKQLTGGVRATLKSKGVDMVDAEAVIKGRCADGYEVEADGKVFQTKRLLIATGSEALVPPIPGVKEQFEAGFVLTNREILQIKEIPKALAIIGGGVIGLEMASYFNSAGSKVTVIEMLDSVGGPIDVDMSKLLEKNYKAKGVDFKLGCRVTKVEAGKVFFDKDGHLHRV